MKTNLGIPGTSLGAPGNSQQLLAPVTIWGPQKRPYLNQYTAPEALDCCIQILSLQRIAPRTTLAHFIVYTSRTEPFWSATGPNWGRPKVSGGGGRPWKKGVCPYGPQGQAPLYKLDSHKPRCLYHEIYTSAGLVMRVRALQCGTS